MSLNYLSIDVGIKNLAYCIIQKHNQDYFKMMDWNIVDISTFKKDKDKCCFVENKIIKPKKKKNRNRGNSIDDENYKLINNKECKTKPKYVFGEKLYCAKHAKQCKQIIPNDKMKLSYVKKLKIEPLKKWCLSNFIDISECKTKQKIIKHIEEWFELKVFSLYKAPKASSVSLVDCAKILSYKFDEILDNNKVDVVIIENQIGPLANKMKTIQGMLTQYFVMKGIYNIEYISSRNKLSFSLEQIGIENSIIDNENIEIIMNENNKKKKNVNDKKEYNKRKKQGIDNVNTILDKSTFFNSKEEQIKWIEHFSQSKKKDDLADSLLQGIWYIISHN